MPDHHYRPAFWEGVKDLTPLVSGAMPFGLITGASGISLGLTPEEVMGMTLLLYAGSAQLATYQLLQENAPFIMILFTAVVINLRFAIYSATFAPMLSPLKKRHRFPLAYLISDQVYGLCAMPAHQRRSVGERVAYYTGASLLLFLTWVVSVVMGVVLGTRIPPEWSLEFTIPLAFLSMLVATITNRQLLMVAIISGTCAVLFQLLPYNSGFIVAVVGGVAGGAVLASRFTPTPTASEQ